MLDGQQPQTNGQNQNPTAIWQAAWANKLADILFDFRSFNTIGAWNDLADLKTILPPECETDTEQLYKETEKIVFKPIMVSQVVYYAEQTKKRYRENIVLPAERKLLTAIKKSLFERGWINKDTGFGADANAESKTF